MRSLADYEGGSWPSVGWHEARIVDCEMTESPEKHTPGVEFTFQVCEQQCKKTFYLTDKALVRLGYLAADCGLTEDERRAYDVDDYKSHRTLVSKRLQIRIAKQASDDRYHEIVESAKIGENVSNTPSDPRADRSAEAATTQPPKDADIPF